MKNMTLEEYKEVGKQAKLVEQELTKLIRTVSSKAPKEVMNPLLQSKRNIERFKSKAEERMIKTKVSSDLTIFYGE